MTIFEKFVIVVCVLILLSVVGGCSIKVTRNSQAHYECLEQGIPSDTSYTYMRGFIAKDIVCVVKMEVPIQMEE